MAPEKHQQSPEMVAYYQSQREDLEEQVTSGKLKKVIATNGILYTTLENGKEIGFAASTPELVIIKGDTVYLERDVPDEQFIGRARVINGTSLSTATVNGLRINSNSPDGQPMIDFESLTDSRNHLPKTLGFGDVVSNLTAIQNQRLNKKMGLL